MDEIWLGHSGDGLVGRGMLELRRLLTDGYDGARNSRMPNVGFFIPKEGDYVVEQQNSLRKNRFIEPVGMCTFTEFGVRPTHNTQNNLAPNISGRGQSSCLVENKEIKRIVWKATRIQ